MVLIDAHRVKHGIARFQHSLDLLVACLLVDELSGVNLVRGQKVRLTEADLTFAVRARGEVASPVFIRHIGVREHIIILSGPHNILSLDCVNILWHGRVLNIDVDIGDVLFPVVDK